MKNFLNTTFFLILTIFVSYSSYSSGEILTDASTPLYEQLQLLEYISPFVERVDYSRLLLIQGSVKVIIQDMEENIVKKRSEITFQTLRLIQNLIVQYRFSQVYFGWTTPRAITSIYTERTSQSLETLKRLYERLVTDYGYDDAPYTKITANVFRQMQKLLKQMEDLSLEEELRLQLRDLWMPIGETIAIADQGDRPKTFEKAIPVINRIRLLYPLFARISSSNAGFPLIMEFQGLTEFYAEYAQVDHYYWRVR